MILDRLFDLWHWSMEARWRTWMFHSLFAFILTFLVGPLPVIVLFAAREIEQAFIDVMAGVQTDVVDHIVDFMAPFTVVVLMSATGLIG